MPRSKSRAANVQLVLNAAPKESKLSKKDAKTLKSYKRRLKRFPPSDYAHIAYKRGTIPLMLQQFGASYAEASPEQREARKAMGMSGRGAYSVGRNWRRFSQGLGLTGAGNRLVRAGTDVITNALSGSGMYTGHGAYAGNSLVAGGEMTDDVPHVSSAADETGAITVSRREYVADIYGPTTPFNVQSYALNPGLEQSFPWLSQIAQNYEEYEFQQLIYTYRSTTTDVGTTTTGQCGTVIMATNYNAAAAPFSDKVVMMEYDGAMSCKTTDSMIHGVECDPLKLSGPAGHYIRANPVVSGQDLKTYDHALFQLAVANSPAGFQNQTIGELWVSYTVILRKPKFFVSRGLGITRDVFVSGNGTETTTALLGSIASLLYGQQNNLGSRIDFPAASQIRITFPAAYAGSVEIQLLTEGFTCAAGQNPFTSVVTYTGNIVGSADLYGGGGTAVDDTPRSIVVPHTAAGWTITGSQTSACLLLHVRITPATNGIDNTVVLNTGTLLTAPTQSSLTIQEYNGGFSSRALGIGPSGAQSDAPILVNAQGVIVVP